MFPTTKKGSLIGSSNYFNSPALWNTKNLAATAHGLGHTEIFSISIRDKLIMEVQIHKLRGKSLFTDKII